MGHGPWDQDSWNESRLSRVPMVQIWMLSDVWLSRYVKFQTLEHKTLTQCDADNQGDYSSCPCASYRPAKNELFTFAIKVFC